MTAKDYLSKVQTLRTMIEQKKERINEIRYSASTAQAIRFDVEKLQGGKHIDKIADAVSQIVDMEKEVESEIVNLIFKQHEIIKQIQQLDNCNYIKLLYKRYVECKTLQVAAEEMNYSYQYILELHKKALVAFGKKHKTILQEGEDYIGNNPFFNRIG